MENGKLLQKKDMASEDRNQSINNIGQSEYTYICAVLFNCTIGGSLSLSKYLGLECETFRDLSQDNFLKVPKLSWLDEDSKITE